MKSFLYSVGIVISVMGIFSCASMQGIPQAKQNTNSTQDTSSAPSPQNSSPYQLYGIASYYADKFHGRLTASGEVFDMNALTAAHRELPFGTVVNVTNMNNGKSVQVYINDRGPFVKNRVIDLSRYAASRIGMIGPGTAPVRLKIISLGAGGYKSSHAKSTTGSIVQVASYSKKESAEKLLRYLSTQNLKPEIEIAGPYYRVVIPQLNDAQVQSTKTTLAELGFSDVLVR